MKIDLFMVIRMHNIIQKLRLRNSSYFFKYILQVGWLRLTMGYDNSRLRFTYNFYFCLDSMWLDLFAGNCPL